MTSANLDTRIPLPPLSKPEPDIIQEAAITAGATTARRIRHLLNVAASTSFTPDQVARALAEADTEVGRFIDFAVLGGFNPVGFSDQLDVLLGELGEAARALIRAQVIARLSRARRAKVPA